MSLCQYLRAIYNSDSFSEKVQEYIQQHNQNETLLAIAHGLHTAVEQVQEQMFEIFLQRLSRSKEYRQEQEKRIKYLVELANETHIADIQEEEEALERILLFVEEASIGNYDEDKNLLQEQKKLSIEGMTTLPRQIQEGLSAENHNLPYCLAPYTVQAQIVIEICEAYYPNFERNKVKTWIQKTNFHNRDYEKRKKMYMRGEEGLSPLKELQRACLHNERDILAFMQKQV